MSTTWRARSPRRSEDGDGEDRVDDEIFAVQEELEAKKAKLEEIQAQRERAKDRLGAAQTKEQQDAQVADAALNEILEQVSGEVLRACKKIGNRKDRGEGRQESTRDDEDNIAGMFQDCSEQNRAKLQEIVRNVTQGAQDLADARSGAQTKGRRVFVHRILPSGVDFSDRGSCCVILATPELTFEELTALALQRWGLSNETSDELHVIVDQAGTTWPGKVNVLREICHGAEPRLFLETVERTRQELRLGGDSLQNVAASRIVAPLLGAHAVRAHERALAGETAPTQRKGLDAEGRTFYIDEVLHSKSRFLWDFVLMLLLTALLTTGIVIENVTILNETMEQLDSVRRIPFVSERGSYIVFANISTWRDLYGFARGPLAEILQVTTGALARNEVIMPIRVRQNRVTISRFGDPQCPDLAATVVENLQQEFCYPRYEESTKASTFFQGAESPPSIQDAGLSEEAQRAFEYVQNPWGPTYRWQYPPFDSPDLIPMQEFPSEGYVFSLPVKADASVDTSLLQELDASSVPWVDDQTRFVGLSLTFYNANYGVFVAAHFNVWLSVEGAHETALSVHALNDLTESSTFILFSIAGLAMLIVMYMMFTLVQYFRATVRSERKRSRLRRERERNARLTQGLTGARVDKEDLAMATAGGARFSKIFAKFILNMWNAIDIFIIFFTLMAVSYSIICYRCPRFTKLPIPSYERFIDVSILSRFVESGRIFASHAIALLAVKFFKYLRVPVFVFLEFGILYYSVFRILVLALLVMLVTLAFSIASYFFYVGDLSRGAHFLHPFLWWLRTFAGDVDLPIEPKEPILGVSLEIIFVLFMYLFVIKTIVAICFQARIEISAKRMQHEIDTKTLVLGLSGEIATHVKQWWQRNKVGQPNF